MAPIRIGPSLSLSRKTVCQAGCAALRAMTPDTEMAAKSSRGLRGLMPTMSLP